MVAILLLISLLAPNEARTANIIRGQELALAKAWRTGDRQALRDLSDDKLTVTFQHSCLVEASSVQFHRDDWVDALIRNRPAGYEASISGIAPIKLRRSNRDALAAGDELMTANLTEIIVLSLAPGEALTKHLSAMDLWEKNGGTWRLINRLYSSEHCNNEPGLIFPSH